MLGRAGPTVFGWLWPTLFTEMIGEVSVMP